MNQLKLRDPDSYDKIESIMGGEYNLKRCYFRKEHAHDIFTTEEYDLITNMDPPEIYGWPIFSNIRGESILARSYISNDDHHPDAKGQTNIASAIVAALNRPVS